MKNADKKIVYVCDIDEDIDDMIAVEYLHINNRLDYVVCDRPSSSPRIEDLQMMGVKFRDNIENASIVFCGGAFTKVAEYIESDNIDLFVANGGFAGDNIIDNPLPKFRGKVAVRTFNLNLDVQSALRVFDTHKIKEIRLVAKNVCHSGDNVFGKIHKDGFLEKYKLRDGKRLHDLLMVKEGLHLVDNASDICEYTNVRMYVKGDDKYALWGSLPDEDSNIEIAIKIR